jgi:peptidoglycan/LPS O-acetylase OafA/YrhL
LVEYRFAGGIAVEVFFLISGFLITASMARSSLRHYLWARVLRIFPALAVCIILSTFVLGPLLTTDSDYWRNASTWRYFYNNATLFATEYWLPGVFQQLPNKAINGSLWSLLLEVRLYLVVAGLGLLGLLRKKTFNTIIVICFITGYFVVPQVDILKQYSAWVSCVAFFSAGAFVWINRDEIKLTSIGVVVVLLFAAALHRSEHFFVAYFATLTYLTFYLAFVPAIPRIEKRDLSYGVYLYGWPVQQCVLLFMPNSGAVTNAILASTFCLLLAAASWAWIERPCLALKRLVK